MGNGVARHWRPGVAHLECRSGLGSPITNPQLRSIASWLHTSNRRRRQRETRAYKTYSVRGRGAGTRYAAWLGNTEAALSLLIAAAAAAATVAIILRTSGSSTIAFPPAIFRDQGGWAAPHGIVCRKISQDNDTIVDQHWSGQDREMPGQT